MKNFLITHPLYKKIILGAIWLILVCGMILVLKKEISPVIAIDSLTVSYPELTDAILPGDVIEQNIFWDKSTLESIDIAFSYPDDVFPDTQVMISVLRDDRVIADQLLNLTSLPNGSYLNFCLGQTDCNGATFTIRIENVSEDSSSAFYLLCTDNEHFYLPQVSNYRRNSQVENSRLLCQMYYTESYSYYKACVMASWLLLIGLILTGLIQRLPNGQ